MSPEPKIPSLHSIYCIQFNEKTGRCEHPNCKALQRVTHQIIRDRQNHPIKAINALLLPEYSNKIGDNQREQLREIREEITQLKDELPSGVSLDERWNAICRPFTDTDWMWNLQSRYEKFLGIDQQYHWTGTSDSKLQRWLNDPNISCDQYHPIGK